MTSRAKKFLNRLRVPLANDHVILISGSKTNPKKSELLHRLFNKSTAGQVGFFALIAGTNSASHRPVKALETFLNRQSFVRLSVFTIAHFVFYDLSNWFVLRGISSSSYTDKAVVKLIQNFTARTIVVDLRARKFKKYNFSFTLSSQSN